MRYYVVLSLICNLAVVYWADAQTVGNCEHGEAEADLDVNNVRARINNTGNLFWRGSGRTYFVPKEGTAQSIFTIGLWIGGLDNEGIIRFAGSAYGPFEFWPGPLDASGNPPADCSDYDRIFSVYRSDLRILDETSVATSDILDWPYELGAPVIDGDGILDNYNLAEGDRPDIEGDQMLWWVMNDVGNEKQYSFRQPIGLEVHVSAYAFHDSSSLDNTTFYRYELVNKGVSGFNEAYFGLFVDADIGNGSNDFVGSDSIAGMAFTYNGTDFDPGVDGYGTTPPALGVDFISGPVNDTAPEGTQVSTDRLKGRSVQLNTFLFWNSDSSVQGNPDANSDDPYNYLRAIWRDNTPMTYGGTGYGGAHRTRFMWTGNPAKRKFWSEENLDGFGQRNTPASRRFLMSAGPFNMAPGETQDISFAIIWSRSFSRLASVAKLYEDNVYIQGLYDRGWVPQLVIDAPVVSYTTTGNNVVLQWENPPSSNNYLDSFDERSGYVYNKLGENPDLTYTFEGYDVIQYASEVDSVGEVIATYDVINDITAVSEERFDAESELYLTSVAARGTDSGISHEHLVTRLTNYKSYYFGIQPYAYNERSLPQVHRGEVSRISVVPGETTSSKSPGQILASIGVVPNPYVINSDYEVNLVDRKVRFTAMPEQATIRIFTLAGTLVRTLEKNDTLPYLEWDLLNEDNRRLGSGVYLVHVDVPDIGERVIKFGHVGRDR